MTKNQILALKPGDKVRTVLGDVRRVVGHTTYNVSGLPHPCVWLENRARVYFAIELERVR